MMDYKAQKEEIAFYMQMLLEAYKEGDLEAYEELLRVYRIYEPYFYNSKSEIIDFLRKKVGEGSQNSNEKGGEK